MTPRRVLTASTLALAFAAPHVARADITVHQPALDLTAAAGGAMNAIDTEPFVASDGSGEAWVAWLRPPAMPDTMATTTVFLRRFNLAMTMTGSHDTTSTGQQAQHIALGMLGSEPLLLAAKPPADAATNWEIDGQLFHEDDSFITHPVVPDSLMPPAGLITALDAPQAEGGSTGNIVYVTAQYAPSSPPVPGGRYFRVQVDPTTLAPVPTASSYTLLDGAVSGSIATGAPLDALVVTLNPPNNAIMFIEQGETAYSIPAGTLVAPAVASTRDHGEYIAAMTELAAAGGLSGMRFGIYRGPMTRPTIDTLTVPFARTIAELAAATDVSGPTRAWVAGTFTDGYLFVASYGATGESTQVFQSPYGHVCKHPRIAAFDATGALLVAACQTDGDVTGPVHVFAWWITRGATSPDGGVLDGGVPEDGAVNPDAGEGTDAGASSDAGALDGAVAVDGGAGDSGASGSMEGIGFHGGACACRAAGVPARGREGALAFAAIAIALGARRRRRGV